MNPKQIKLAQLLTALGVIPFAGSLIIYFIRADVSLIHAHYLSLTYGAIIASFISGVHWGLFLNRARETPINLLVSSNIFAILAWLSLLFIVPITQYLLQITCFISLLLIDKKLAAHGVIEGWFYQLRKQASTAVILILFISAYIFHRPYMIS